MFLKNTSGYLARVATAVLVAAGAAEAQPIGVRAAGLAEAFVAVADDASSVYWNPAGMASGAFVSFVVDFGLRSATPDSGSPSASGWTQDGRLIAFTIPPAGLSYYRLSTVVAEPQGAEVDEPPDRQDGRRAVHGLTTNNIGVTVAQSLSNYLVVAATVRYVNGEVTRGIVETTDTEDALDQASSLPRRTSSTVDVDAGVMMAVERLRLGLVARNLAAPSFDSPDPAEAAVGLDRTWRVGAAWGDGWPGTAGLIVSADADLTGRDTPTGERRDVAAGVETWWLRQRLGVRGGVRASTLGEARPVGATGVSAGIRNGIFVEGHAAWGEREERSWSVGVRVTF